MTPSGEYSYLFITHKHLLFCILSMKGFDKFVVCYRRIEGLVRTRILFISPDPHTDPLPRCCGSVDLDSHPDPGANYLWIRPNSDPDPAWTFFGH